MNFVFNVCKKNALPWLVVAQKKNIEAVWSLFYGIKIK